MMELSISAKSDMGCLRSNNEDMLLISTQSVRDGELNTKVFLTKHNKYVLAVADGMGGHEHGEIASEMVVESLASFVQSLPDGLGEQDLNELIDNWLDDIHQQVNTTGEDECAETIKGTTLIALLFYEGRVFWFNCGDSRLYRFRGGLLVQLSRNHSLDTLTGNESDAHMLINCIGAGADHCYVDFEDITTRVLTGDTFLLCSDGMSDMCEDEQMEQLMYEGAQANRLVDQARANGGRDNVSVIVAHVKL